MRPQKHGRRPLPSSLYLFSIPAIERTEVEGAIEKYKIYQAAMLFLSQNYCCRWSRRIQEVLVLYLAYSFFKWQTLVCLIQQQSHLEQTSQQSESK